MPRGSGRPDLSQRPRREAPGMLTAIAILERELGINEYNRHLLRRRLATKPAPEEARRLRRELGDLEKRRLEALRLLEEQHADYEQRRLAALARWSEPR